MNRDQAITWTNADLLWIEPLARNLKKLIIKNNFNSR